MWSYTVQIPEKHWESVKTQLLTLISKSSRSSQPQIFGAAPAAPVQKQRQSAGQLQVTLFTSEARSLSMATVNPFLPCCCACFPIFVGLAPVVAAVCQPAHVCKLDSIIRLMSVVLKCFDARLLQGSASVLETAAAEMGQAAASLVAIERQIGELTQQGVRPWSPLSSPCRVLAFGHRMHCMHTDLLSIRTCSSSCQHQLPARQ